MLFSPFRLCRPVPFFIMRGRTERETAPRRKIAAPEQPDLSGFLRRYSPRKIYLSTHKEVADFPPAKRWSPMHGEGVAEMLPLFNQGSGCWYSPALFLNMRRNMEHMRSADTVALDFDDGVMTLDGAREEFRKCEGVLHTTMSHQKPKKDAGPCDRFRVVLPLSMRVLLDEYRLIWTLLAKRIYADSACEGNAAPSQAYRCGANAEALGGNCAIDVKAALK